VAVRAPLKHNAKLPQNFQLALTGGLRLIYPPDFSVAAVVNRRDNLILP
jgi:hypothetical protein